MNHDKRCLAAAIICAVENVRDTDPAYADFPNCNLETANFADIAKNYLDENITTCRCVHKTTADFDSEYENNILDDANLVVTVRVYCNCGYDFPPERFYGKLAWENAEAWAQGTHTHAA